MPSNNDKTKFDIRGNEGKFIGTVYLYNGCKNSPDAEIEFVLDDPGGKKVFVTIRASANMLEVQDGGNTYTPVASLKRQE